MLEAIDRFGSISAAAPAVDLTFRQLWRQVQMLNSLFDQPLIGIRRSGRSSGAFLTLLGKEVLARFREMQQVANETLEPHFRAFEKLVGLDPNALPPVPRYARIIDPATIPIARKQKRAARASTKAKNRSGNPVRRLRRNRGVPPNDVDGPKVGSGRLRSDNDQQHVVPPYKSWELAVAHDDRLKKVTSGAKRSSDCSVEEMLVVRCRAVSVPGLCR
jgi:molybdate transport system regulatory protein